MRQLLIISLFFTFKEVQIFAVFQAVWGFHRSDVHPSGAVLRRIFVLSESYCGRMRQLSGGSVAYGGGIIVSVFSVVASWSGGYSEELGDTLWCPGGLAGWFQRYLERCGWYFGSVGVSIGNSIGGAFQKVP